MTIWGNHSSTQVPFVLLTIFDGFVRKRPNPLWTNISTAQFPDAFHATINGKSVVSLINNDAWIQNEFIPIVQVSQSPPIFWKNSERWTNPTLRNAERRWSRLESWAPQCPRPRLPAITWRAGSRCFLPSGITNTPHICQFCYTTASAGY